MYAPYGEERINQHPFFYRERFTFTGKERDAETGYDYFGARNYLSALSIWGAVDPLADKYIYNSPYVYCEGNPIIYIDPTGLYGYRNDDGDYQWYPNQVAESFTDETGKQWTLVAKNEKNFTEATTIRQAVVEGLIDSGYEGDAKNDVGLYKESSPLFTKEACFNGDISAFLSWDEKPNSDPTARKSSKAYQSKEIRNSKYAIKFYEEKNGETNAIGIVRTNLSHYIEAGIEWLERKIYGEKATEDPLYDMHYRNAQRLLEHLSSSPK